MPTVSWLVFAGKPDRPRAPTPGDAIWYQAFRRRRTAPATKPQPDGTLVKALARAWQRQRMLDEGRFASVREMAEAERVSLSFVSRILRLALLAPETAEWIMDGRRVPQLSQLMLPFPAEWERQRERLRQ
jgi:hypothetical protein